MTVRAAPTSAAGIAAAADFSAGDESQSAQAPASAAQPGVGGTSSGSQPAAPATGQPATMTPEQALEAVAKSLGTPQTATDWESRFKASSTEAHKLNSTLTAVRDVLKAQGLELRTDDKGKVLGLVAKGEPANRTAPKPPQLTDEMSQALLDDAESVIKKLWKQAGDQYAEYYAKPEATAEESAFPPSPDMLGVIHSELSAEKGADAQAQFPHYATLRPVVDQQLAALSPAMQKAYYESPAQVLRMLQAQAHYAYSKLLASGVAIANQTQQAAQQAQSRASVAPTGQGTQVVTSGTPQSVAAQIASAQ